MGSETECLTVVNPPERFGEAAARFFARLEETTPTLAGPSGLFLPLGRIYLDGDHLELATCECASPFELVACQLGLERLAARIAAEISVDGPKLELFTIGHGGLLAQDSPAWGHHGNHLVAWPPEELAPLIVPFLATQFIAGTGGRLADGTWIATARHVFLDREVGGSTVSARALAGTSRDEPLTPEPERFGYRFHAIHGDATVRPWSRTLAAGTLALALRAAAWNADLVRPLPRHCEAHGRRAFWMRVARLAQRLAGADAASAVDPIAIAVQRHYLQLVDRMLADWPDAPAWTGQVVVMWDAVLTACERNDPDWLAERLDPWAKRARLEWADGTSEPRRAEEIALACQEDHRLVSDGPTVAAPFTIWEPDAVPATATRAVPRARAIREGRGRGWLADWHVVTDGVGRGRRFDDPRAGFAVSSPE